MPRVQIAVATLLAAGTVATPSAARPDAENAKPRIVSVELKQDGAKVEVVVVARDRDDVVRGAEISWGEDGPEQGTSICTVGPAADGEKRRGKRERFKHSYSYPAAGTYAITVRVTSGGCGKRRAQASRRRTLTVAVG